MLTANKQATRERDGSVTVDFLFLFDWNSTNPHIQGCNGMYVCMSWTAGQLAGRLVGWSAGRLVDRLADWQVGWLAGWLASWLAGWLPAWLAGWLPGQLAGCLAVPSHM